MTNHEDPREAPGPHGPLHGVRVLEFSQIIAGPAAGLYLSDFGADVVKVEPPEGEARRNAGAIVPNAGKYFQALNRGKRSLVVDLARPEGRALIHRLLPGFDVVVINYRPQAARKLGIDYETLAALRPDLIYASITGFGHRGPEAGRAGSDIVAQGYSGLMAAEGRTDDAGAPRQIASAPYADRASGIVAAMGVNAALYHRALTGEGQELHISLLHTALELLSRYVMREPLHDVTLRDPLVERLDELRAAGAPYEELIAERSGHTERFATHRLYYGGYHTRSGSLVLGGVTRRNREALRALLGVEDETDSPDFDAADEANVERVERWREQIQQRLLERTAEQWLALLDEAGVPATVVHFPEEMADDPQVRAMGMMSDLDHPVTGPQRVVGPLVGMSRSPTAASRPAPMLGEHSEELLREAGLDGDEIAALRDAGVLGG